MGMKNVAIVLAGGVGTRMKDTSTPKQFLKLANKEIIIRTLENFENNKNTDAIIVSCISEYKETLNHLLHKYHISKVKSIVDGGKTGQLSIYNALLEAKRLYDECIVIIHDGVRPFIDDKIIDGSIVLTKQKGNAISYTSSQETIAYDGKVLDREKCKALKAPQTFLLSDILKYQNEAIKSGKVNYIDSATLLANYGVKLNFIESDTFNVKITTPFDFFVANAVYEQRNYERVFG
jgi:2-C-methyl-D-erythritol 4-phosphate cytidylyltransferase